MTRRAALAALPVAVLLAVQPRAAGTASSIGVSASGSALAAWADRVDTMLAAGQLDLGVAQEDTQVAGREHERLPQIWNGLPVFGGQLIRQVEGRRLVSISGRLFENVQADISPDIPSDVAAEAAARAIGADAVPSNDVTLGVLPLDEGGYALAYRLDVRSAWDLQTCFVDARTGGLLLRFSRIETQIGRGTGVFGDTKKVSATQVADTFQAVDGLRPAAGLTLDFRGIPTRLNTFLASGRVSASDYATDSDNVWVDPSQAAVVDAHAYQGFTYDYYFRRFGRRGLNDRNIAITGIVHPLARADASRYSEARRGLYINNAAYVGGGYIFYGDGDGRLFDYFAGALDVVGHELTHGVTEFTSNLIYRNESGALSEAFSDIMGVSIEFFYQPAGDGQQRADWLIGEDITRVQPGFIRSLQNPLSDLAADPDHYSLLRDVGTSFDNGGVHENSTIVSHGYYLAVAGGRNRVSGVTVAGVGLANRDRMEQIFYRAWTFYLTPGARFTDARAATLRAADDLYGAGSNERAQVLAAWDAVGVK